jgi:hypothetical protein
LSTIASVDSRYGHQGNDMVGGILPQSSDRSMTSSNEPLQGIIRRSDWTKYTVWIPMEASDGWRVASPHGKIRKRFSKLPKLHVGALISSTTPRMSNPLRI